MSNEKIKEAKVIVKKISLNEGNYPIDQYGVLIGVSNGQITDIIQGVKGDISLNRDENQEWYFVDTKEYNYRLGYVYGKIRFSFSFNANVGFPTLIYNQVDMLDKDMSIVLLEWAKDNIKNIMSKFLDGNGVNDNAKLFEKNFDEDLERELLKQCREHFIKHWGMFLNSVTINTQKIVEKTTNSTRTNNAQKKRKDLINELCF